MRTNELLKRQGNQQIDAIGVLGTDVYDKLLVLQALRPYFPNAQFFTTDFDALLLDPADAKWTRGLLVASSFGPALRDEIQQQIPPFRSGYQTAAFLATRYAVRDSGNDDLSLDTTRFGAALREHLTSARLAQVGRSEVLWLPPDSGAVETSSSPRGQAARTDCREDLLNCSHLHPPTDRLYPELDGYGARIAFGASAAGLLLGLPLLSERVRRRARSRLHRIRARRRLWHQLKPLAVSIGLPIFIAVALSGAWTWIAPALTGYGDGEPMTLTQGISLWPTTLIRLFITALCAWFIFDSGRRSFRNLDEITRQLALPETVAELRRKWRAEWRSNPRPWARRFLDIFSRKFHLGTAPQSVPQEIQFWGTYVWHGQLGTRFARASIGVGAMILLSVILAGFFGWPVVPAHRGPIGQVYFWITLASVLAMLFLLFLVADAALYCVWFVWELRNQNYRWPTKTTTFFKTKFGFLADFPDDWIDLEFIALRTKAMSTIIYYPFAAIALMIASRSKIFDNFSESVPILATTAAGIAITIGCSIALSRAAETSRKAAIARLNEQITAANGAANAGLVAQLSTLLTRVQALDEGAFTPWSQQPLTRALLLPIASYGGTAWLEYPSLLGF